MLNFRKENIKNHFDLECNTGIFDLNKYSKTKEEAMKYVANIGGISIYHKNLEKSFLIPYGTRSDFQKFLLSWDLADISDLYTTENKKIGVEHIAFILK